MKITGRWQSVAGCTKRSSGSEAMTETRSRGVGGAEAEDGVAAINADQEVGLYLEDRNTAEGEAEDVTITEEGEGAMTVEIRAGVMRGAHRAIVIGRQAGIAKGRKQKRTNRGKSKASHGQQATNGDQKEIHGEAKTRNQVEGKTGLGKGTTNGAQEEIRGRTNEAIVEENEALLARSIAQSNDKGNEHCC